MGRRKKTDSPMSGGSAASRREQALCIDALESGEYDDLTDKEWVAMCERTARDHCEDDCLSESLAHASQTVCAVIASEPGSQDAGPG